MSASYTFVGVEEWGQFPFPTMLDCDHFHVAGKPPTYPSPNPTFCSK